jgi:cell division protein FtsW (lipid II flippase)
VSNKFWKRSSIVTMVLAAALLVLAMLVNTTEPFKSTWLRLSVGRQRPQLYAARQPCR